MSSSRSRFFTFGTRYQRSTSSRSENSASMTANQNRTNDFDIVVSIGFTANGDMYLARGMDPWIAAVGKILALYQKSLKLGVVPKELKLFWLRPQFSCQRIYWNKSQQMEENVAWREGNPTVRHNSVIFPILAGIAPEDRSNASSSVINNTACSGPSNCRVQCIQQAKRWE